MKKFDAESFRPSLKLQVNIKIQLNMARVSRLSFHFLWLLINIILNKYNRSRHPANVKDTELIGNQAKKY